MMTMMQGREVNSLGTLRFKSKDVPSSSNGFFMVRAIKTILKMTVPKQWNKLLHRREREDDIVVNPFSVEEIVKDKRIFDQNFTFRSSDMGPFSKATIESLMILLQSLIIYGHVLETTLNHIRNMGLLNDGLGSTPEMSKKNLIWVLSNMHIVVAHYPSLDDNVQVDNWFISSGNNGQFIEWIIDDCWTKKIYARATSKLVMSKETRKLSKIPEGVRREMESQYLHCYLVMDRDNSRLPRIDHSRTEHVRTGLTHVNNVKYVGLMLGRKECVMNDVLQSLTDCLINADEWNHLLRLDSGTVVA
ncbi:hypothetical protein NE237_025463 [Protea cynaroides]|uniref:Acyl-[acyl-carrier-protein] hydrolase n=1 Tax=Protea cynaroides TaxID=273540 RepID=A0A9Q0K0K2_9MAGN|nr:hypothetical protein NE237_025463 [Protea cynaroides]